MVRYLFLIFSNQETQKITISANWSPGERILRFGLCLSWYPKWVFYIGNLLEAIGIVLETHFGFEFCNGSPGDSLTLAFLTKMMTIGISVMNNGLKICRDASPYIASELTR